MSLAIVYSRASSGISAPLVTVETHLSWGMAGFLIVGLPEAAVKESRDRVRSALINTNFEFPNRKIIVNLAPADLPKEGGRFDLPIALGILAASGQLPLEVLQHYEFTGELALSGELRAIRGVLPVVLASHQANRPLVVPDANAAEAALVKKASVLKAEHLLQVCAHLTGGQALPPCEISSSLQRKRPLLDLSDVKGQPHAKRALEIAAAGGHSMLFLGPPGTGKTMLASRLTGILPVLSEDDALASAAIASVSSAGFQVEEWGKIPFRAPHHSSSGPALVGGGRPPRPGEISLAHKGVLFLDELPEFSRHVLECLREPLESGYITISRSAYQTVFPAHFQFLAAMNPCPCGYAGSRIRQCQCTSDQVKRYMNKISGPLLDRIDMQVEVASLSPKELSDRNLSMESSESVRARVAAARAKQLVRQGKCNQALTASELENVCVLQAKAQDLLHHAMTKFNLSARVYHRLMKVSLTIADVANVTEIDSAHVSEALSFRCLDRYKSMIN